MLVAQVGEPLAKTLPRWISERPEVKPLVKEDLATLEAMAAKATEPLRDEALIVASKFEPSLLGELRTLRDIVRLADQESREEDAIVARARLWRTYEDSAKELRVRVTSKATTLMANGYVLEATWDRDKAVVDAITTSVIGGKKNLVRARIDDVRWEIKKHLRYFLRRQSTNWCDLAIPSAVDQAVNPHLARWQKLATFPRSK